MLYRATGFAFALSALLAGAVQAADSGALRAATLAGRAIPDRGGLSLVLASGQHLRMIDNTRGCPIDDHPLDDGHCYRYSLVADLPKQHAFIVSESYAQGQSLLLIDDRTGRQTGIDGMPVFSADGSRFFVNDDETLGAHDTNFEIWRRDGDGAVLEWAHLVKPVHAEDPPQPKAYHTEVVDWSSADVISLAFSGAHSDWNGQLTRGAKGWTLTADWPKP